MYKGRIKAVTGRFLRKVYNFQYLLSLCKFDDTKGNTCANIILSQVGQKKPKKKKEEKKVMKKYKNIDSGRIAVLVVDNLTKTMKYEDDGSEEIITPASFKHEWEFVSDDEPVAPAEPVVPVETVETVPVEPVPVEEPKPENPVELEPTDEPSDEDDSTDPYEKLLKEGMRKDVVDSLRRMGVLD